jgi:hypothetical protein
MDIHARVAVDLVEEVGLVAQIILPARRDEIAAELPLAPESRE